MGIEFDEESISEIMISVKAMTKIFSYTRTVNSEIGGLMLVNEDENIPIIEDVVLYKQEVTSTTVELDAEELGKQMSILATKNPKKISMLKGWWHSHNDFQTFWSATDDECFENFINAGCNITYGVVVNKDGSIKARVDIKTPIGIVRFKNIKLTVYFPNSKLRYMKEARRKVSIPKVKSYKSYKSFEKQTKFEREFEKSNEKIDDFEEEEIRENYGDEIYEFY